MDEFAVFKDVVSEANIASIYKRQKPAVTFVGTDDGLLTSRVMDSNKPAGINWNTLSFRGQAPYAKELIPSTAETVYSLDNAPASLYTGLKAYWKFNGTEGASINNGATIADASGNNHPLTAVNGGNTSVGLSYQAGVLNTSVVFTGDEATDWLEAADHADFSFDSDANYSWMFWFSKDTVNYGEWEALYSVTAGGNDYIGIYPMDSNSEVNMGVGFYIQNTANGGLSCYTYDQSFKSAEYYHLVVTYDGTIGTYVNRVKIYLNGINVTGRCVTNGGSMGDFDPWAIQIGDAEPWPESFDGKIDEGAFWHRTLSDAEALQLYRRGTNRLKFQVRACTNADCSDGTFVGPGNSTTAFFTEESNSGVGFPSFTLPSFGLKRYFQYRMTMDINDPNTNITLEQVDINGSE
jgi:hypothetical protein